MCVEIIQPQGSVAYNTEQPFKEQVMGSKEVLIDCESTCPRVVKFLDEIEKICKDGTPFPINLKIKHNGNLHLFKKNKQINNDLGVNDIIKGLVQFHKKADDGLREIAEMCSRGKCGR